METLKSLRASSFGIVAMERLGESIDARLSNILQGVQHVFEVLGAKKLLGAPGIATRSGTLLGAPIPAPARAVLVAFFATNVKL